MNNKWWVIDKGTVRGLLALALVAGVVILAVTGNQNAVAAVISGAGTALGMYLAKD